MRPDVNNARFQVATDFVNNTGRHIFLTGKAGTGKTTFLKHIKSTTRKNCIVVAPTGVAAINAGGVTMHSFFQLPFGPFLPIIKHSIDTTTTNKHSLFRNIHFTRNKQQMLKELELLIIDEISMVRADALDAMDTILRHFRKNPLVPFGGVQVLYIGDMYQLPPVANEAEWQFLSDHYASPFFFDAKVIQEAPPLYIELKKIYRQSEQRFIDVLNNVRNNRTTDEDMQLLNSYYMPGFIPPKEDKYIILTTHNNIADRINNDELARLSSKLYTFRGEINGDFNEKSLPADLHLHLKEGAQVMFIKNDKGDSRRYYNGKLATVKKVNYEKIIVTLAGSKEEVMLEKETWKNIRYKLNEGGGEIEEEELGTFKQYPIRLAWAVTIHKSQGLTFEKAIIDAGYSFAAGQVYVALSRCTVLKGIILRSRIERHNISTDYRVVEFAQREASQEYLNETLCKEKRVYELQAIKKLFEWNKLIESLKEWQANLLLKKLDKQADIFVLTCEMIKKAYHQQEVAFKFQKQLENIIDAIEEPNAIEKLKERMNSAISYFTKALYEELILPLRQHIKEMEKQSKVKQYVLELTILHNQLWNKLEDIWNAIYDGSKFNEGLLEYKRYNDTAASSNSAKPSSKQQPGNTRKESLRHYQEGKTIDEIAVLRNLAKGTVESHLAESIGLGELELIAVLNESKIADILPVVEKYGHTALSPIREELGEDYSFAEIRMVAQYVKRMADLTIQ